MKCKFFIGRLLFKQLICTFKLPNLDFNDIVVFNYKTQGLF